MLDNAQPTQDFVVRRSVGDVIGQNEPLCPVIVTGRRGLGAKTNCNILRLGKLGISN